MQIVCKPRNQIFISHSAKDKEISSFFIRKFRNTSVVMEYENSKVERSSHINKGPS